MCFKMKKLFTGGSKKTDRNSDTISDKTIDRIVCKKEEVSLIDRLKNYNKANSTYMVKYLY